MKRKLPPLAALATAEAVSRHGSFAAAAAELNVTPSAISHQIRGLESWLGFKLFVRNARSLDLTDRGRAYLLEVAGVLNALEAATLAAMEDAGKIKILRIQTTDSFASRWLVSRLSSFQAEHPSITVQIVTREYTERFRPEDADFAILYGRGDWRDFVCKLLLKESILPVCCPALSAPGGADILSRNRLIHDDNLGTSWEEWLGFANVALEARSSAESGAGLHFNHSHLALQAAERGSGVALASHPLVMDALRDGALVAPFAEKLDTGLGYHIVQVADARQRRRCKPLVDWLIKQGRDGAPPAPLT